MNAPLISFRPAQEEAFWSPLGLLFLLWRRQFGKSRTLGAWGLKRMMERRNHSVFYCSAAIRLGVENIRKEAELWIECMRLFREAAKRERMLLESNGDGLDVDAVADLFEHQKLETRLYHDRTSYSRSMVVAPNPTTAVGWTGDVVMDEVGRMPELKEMIEALEPIMSSNPEFLWRMASTPPPEDDHYSWELIVPPHDEFPLNPRGNWYVSQAGLHVHRVDAYDAYAGGFPMFSKVSRLPISPDEHRAEAFDKTGWDRNYGLHFIAGGTAAVSLAAIHLAMERGKYLGAANNVTEEIAA
jgi:hypothetical protein